MKKLYIKNYIFLLIIFLHTNKLNTVTYFSENREKEIFSLSQIFSDKASKCADSIYNALTLEEKVAHLFLEKGAFNSKIIPDISDGFYCGVNDLIFPNYKTILFLNKEQWIEIYPILFNYLNELGVSVFFASDEYPFYVKNKLANNLTSNQSLWLPTGTFKNKIPEAYKLNIVSDISNIQSFKAGNIFKTSDFTTDFNIIINALNNGEITQIDLEKICKYILAFSYETKQMKKLPTFDINLKQKETIMRKIYENSVSIFQNKTNNPFPIKTLDINIGYIDNEQSYFQYFKNSADNYLNTDTDKLKPQDYDLIFYLLWNDNFDYEAFEKNLYNIKKQYLNPQIVLLCAGDLPFMDIPVNIDALIYHPFDVSYSWKAMAEAAFGGIEILPKNKNTFLSSTLSKKSQSFPKNRLKYGIPEETGMDSNILTQIDDIVFEAIKNDATPGARVLVAKNGVVVFDKCYGWHTYDKKRPVEKDDIYDLASVTKILATMPVLMQLYDQKKWNLTDKISKFINETDSTDKRGITMKQLLLHESGLPAFIPFYADAIDKKELIGNLFSPKSTENHTIQLDNKLFMNKTAKYNDAILKNEKDSIFSVTVAKDLYMNVNNLDTMYHKILNAKLKKDGKFLYGDLNFILLQKIAENLNQESLDKLLTSNFYNRLGANTLCFNPLHSFSINQIVPTENDKYFRYQLLHGYVHDQTAAMMGGVAGHAGLFGNANDLAKILQMFLNKGEYGGVRYISPETVNFFTSTQSKITKRGLGFDKYDPDKKAYSTYCSPLAYGHLGFTGVIVWIDPKYELIYIFLSNRVHPNQYNSKLSELSTRSKIMETIYQSIVE